MALIPNVRKLRGRASIGATPITLRLAPAQLATLDAWIVRQPDPKPTRPEAVRRLIEAGLHAEALPAPKAAVRKKAAGKP